MNNETTTNTEVNSVLKSNMLVGHSSKETAFEVKDYPYGFRLRTSIFYWIESKPGKGDRFCSYTINPKNGRPNAPKYSTYSTFMYLYLDEDNHVKHGIIDSYERDVFEVRFYFILTKIGECFLNEVQKQNLRINHYQHVYGNAPYEIVKFTEDKKPMFKEWLTATLKHIKTCPFAEIVNYPSMPEFDNPNGHVKMTITNYLPKNS